MAHKNKENESPYKKRAGYAKAIASKNISVDSLKGKHKKPDQIYSANEANDRMADIFRNHNFKCSHEERMQLARFYEILMKNQGKSKMFKFLKFIF